MPYRARCNSHRLSIIFGIGVAVDQQLGSQDLTTSRARLGYIARTNTARLHQSLGVAYITTYRGIDYEYISHDVSIATYLSRQEEISTSALANTAYSGSWHLDSYPWLRVVPVYPQLSSPVVLTRISDLTVLSHSLRPPSNPGEHHRRRLRQRGDERGSRSWCWCEWIEPWRVYCLLEIPPPSSVIQHALLPPSSRRPRLTLTLTFNSRLPLLPSLPPPLSPLLNVNPRPALPQTPSLPCGRSLSSSPSSRAYYGLDNRK
ncbi:hypothetical protein AB1N83_013727 [Pleurotus pulmonarius]